MIFSNNDYEIRKKADIINVNKKSENTIGK